MAVVLLPQSLAVVPPGSSRRRCRWYAIDKPQKYLLSDMPRNPLDHAHGARPDGYLIGLAPLQRPLSVECIPQALVLPQHARAPQHLRHTVVGVEARLNNSI